MSESNRGSLRNDSLNFGSVRFGSRKYKLFVFVKLTSRVDLVMRELLGGTKKGN